MSEPLSEEKRTEIRERVEDREHDGTAIEIALMYRHDGRALLSEIERLKGEVERLRKYEKLQTNVETMLSAVLPVDWKSEE